jgi:hypothetical protein
MEIKCRFGFGALGLVWGKNQLKISSFDALRICAGGDFFNVGKMK